MFLSLKNIEDDKIKLGLEICIDKTYSVFSRVGKTNFTSMAQYFRKQNLYVYGSVLTLIKDIGDKTNLIFYNTIPTIMTKKH